MTNIINIKKSIGVLSITVLALGVSLSTFATVVHADDGYDFSPDTSSGSGYDYAPDYTSGYDFSADTSAGSGYDFAPDYSSGYDFAPDTSSGYDFAPDYASGYDFAPDTISGSGYDFAPDYVSSGGNYSTGGGYGYNYATPTYYSSTPSYSSYAYSTPGLGGGYSSNFYSTPGYGSTPVKTQTPIVYNTPTQTQVQTQTASGQPIVINNNNNNVNTNTNTNTAPVAQVAYTQPQQLVDYVYPTTPTYTTYRAPIVAAAIPGVSLSQIPYTGFDFGPVGDAIYWMGLFLFAVAAAYLLVYYRGGAFSLATALITGRSNVSPVQFTEAETEVATEAPIVEKVPVTNTRIASVISNLPTASLRHVTSDAMIVSHSKNGEVPRIVITRE